MFLINTTFRMLNIVEDKPDKSIILGGTIATYYPASYNTEKKKYINKSISKKNGPKNALGVIYNRANIILSQIHQLLKS